MIPKRLKNRTHPLSEQRKPEHKRATQKCNGDFQSRINSQRAQLMQRYRCSNSTSERQARHEARQNQCGSPNRIAENQSAQAEPESLKKKGAASGEKKNNRDNGRPPPPNPPIPRPPPHP